MKVYSYLVEHDLGLAPNPFGQYCTLAVCKPKIRKSGKLQLGDWIIGTGSKALEETSNRKVRNHLIYAMEVSEIISLEEYWNDNRFQYKKPIMNGTLISMYGDNFYHLDEKGNWIQEDSAHANIDGTPNLNHLKIDTSGKNALISDFFYYFGDSRQSIPESLIEICHVGIGEKVLSDELATIFIEWLKSNFKTGIHGDPINWIEHTQSILF